MENYYFEKNNCPWVNIFNHKILKPSRCPTVLLELIEIVWNLSGDVILSFERPTIKGLNFNHQNRQNLNEKPMIHKKKL